MSAMFHGASNQALTLALGGETCLQAQGPGMSSSHWILPPTYPALRSSTRVPGSPQFRGFMNMNTWLLRESVWRISGPHEIFFLPGEKRDLHDTGRHLTSPLHLFRLSQPPDT